MALTIKKTNSLYHHYQGQTDPQPCYVQLDCDEGTLSADWDGEIGGAVPIAVWNGTALRWGIPALRAEAADDLLERLAPLAQQILNGYERH